MKEIWLKIKDYDGMYEISNLGRIKSLKRNSERILSLTKDRYGYLGVRLCKNGIMKRFKVHRLVAEYFIDNPNNLFEVNHIDGNKENNVVDNLEWSTRSQNLKHAFKLKLKKGTGGGGKSYGEKNGNHKLSVKDVQEIRKKYVFKSKTHGSTALAKEYGVNKKTILSILHNKSWNSSNIEKEE